MMRTSLARAPSSFTPEQQIARQESYEAQLWHERGKGLVDPTDVKWSFNTRLELEADLVRRFGKRRGKAA